MNLAMHETELPLAVTRHDRSIQVIRSDRGPFRDRDCHTSSGHAHHRPQIRGQNLLYLSLGSESNTSSRHMIPKTRGQNEPRVLTRCNLSLRDCLRLAM